MSWRVLLAALAWAGAAPAEERPFGLHFVDAESGRGLPLVEAETTTGQRWVSDSAGWIAFAEPGQLGQEVYFRLFSHGYEVPADGFGFRGQKVQTQPGGEITVKLRRLNLAERLCRLTGAGIYRDSVLLRKPVPAAHPLQNGGVMGQDTVNAVPFRGRLFWLWGDTNRLSYPLGNFHTSGAWSTLPTAGFSPEHGVDYQYLTGPDGFCRALCPLPGPGVVWLEGLATVRDEAGAEQMVARYQRRQGMEKPLQQGLALFNEASETFAAQTSVPDPAADHWQLLDGHPVTITEGGVRYLLFGGAGLQVRVPAELAAVQDPARYEAWSCADAQGLPQRRDGKLHYRWQREAPPVDSAQELKWVQARLIQPEECRISPEDVLTHQRVQLHRGSVHWNAFRQRWVLLAVQQGGRSSYLGEVWYAEAEQPTGPWRTAVKILTHQRYTFYNPVQHPAWDAEGGRVIYFEGTYTTTFSGQDVRTPLYDYNQVLYRLDLADPRLKPVQE